VVVIVINGASQSLANHELLTEQKWDSELNVTFQRPGDIESKVDSFLSSESKVPFSVDPRCHIATMIWEAITKIHSCLVLYGACISSLHDDQCLLQLDRSYSITMYASWTMLPLLFSRKAAASILPPNEF
jgi:hypothetical protein